MTTVTVPDFRFSGFYFAELYQSLLVWKRARCPELTSEDPNDPFIRLLEAFALVGHYSNSLLDHAANEAYLASAKQRESFRDILALIGYRLAQDVPASADLLLKLRAPLSAADEIPALARFATRAVGDTEAVPFEVLTAKALAASDVMSSCLAYNPTLGVYIDNTATFNVDPGSSALWTSPYDAQCALYIGHSTTLWDTIRLVMATAWGSPWTSEHYRSWEYYDGHTYRGTPTAAAVAGPSIEFDVSGFLGAYDRTGLVLRVQSTLTGAYEDVAVSWDGVKNVCSTSFLGQVVPSTDVSRYMLSAEWLELSGVVEEDEGADEKVITFDLPETLDRQWPLATVNGVEAHWVRMRVPRAGVTTPGLYRVRIDEGGQYTVVPSTQGLTVTDDPLGSSTGAADQEFTTTRPLVVNESLAIEVDEGGGTYLPWTEVSDFLSSVPTDRHYVVEYDSDGYATATFGDGTTGRIPPAGVDNVRATYRVDADQDGNVGVGEIVDNLSGKAIIASLSNPREGSGWAVAEASTDDSRALLRKAGPATLRTQQRAVTADDCEDVAKDWTEDGEKPVARARADEAFYGPKTVRVVVVGKGGTALTSTQLAALQTYFNGDPVAGTSGVLVMNNDATVENHVPHPIDVFATVEGDDLDDEALEAAVAAFLEPLYLRPDGEYQHAFGGEVTVSKLIDIIHDADENVTKVTVGTPPADVSLADNELPEPGTVINIVVA